MSDELKRKLTSRKFWVSVAAFLGSIGGSITGLATGNATKANLEQVSNNG